MEITPFSNELIARLTDYPPLASIDTVYHDNIMNIIANTYASFGIKISAIKYQSGPRYTKYLFKPQFGTALNQYQHAKDIALAVQSQTGRVRIIAPDPGTSFIAVEIPNQEPTPVGLKMLLTSMNQSPVNNELLVPIGLDVTGNPYFCDLKQVLHVLVAGATGSGKSIFLRSVILSLLIRFSPEAIRLMLVDPKRVEFRQYNDLPHLMTPVITDPEKVVAALSWAVIEMEKRYKVFAEVGVRDIDSYNELAGFQNLPYMIIIIDELADIMLFAPDKVEDLITRLAQMARASGIHLLLATQRPSVDVLTGLIKANIPCRIAFNVTSMVDSRVIIDGPGAEDLLGNGDLLFSSPQQSLIRLQAAYISDEEEKNIIAILKTKYPVTVDTNHAQVSTHT